MESRRDFLKKGALLTAGAAMAEFFPQSIQRALAINAAAGTTFEDAEHVVFLMQENRSFDHIFGCMKGVRGYADPRMPRQPDGMSVLLQQSRDGKTYPPFHYDLEKTRITWQGGLPHSWVDQSKARNNGRYDKWIDNKGPLCMGYYNRADMPFYHALADAFTVGDAMHCSTLTGTTPNRLMFWTGTINPPGIDAAVVSNNQAESHTGTYVDWLSFPEVLQAHNIDWRVYQNEVWTSKLQNEGVNDWLDNYGDNPLEYLKKYNVKLSAYFRKYGDKTVNPPLSAEEVQRRYNALNKNEQDLVDRAFTTNIHAGFDHLAMAPFEYKDEAGNTKTVDLPANDIFWNFRKDVDAGKLPAVSWLVAPARFSDHTSSPLYGTWYVSEALNILTRNPEVWKKTIFVLNYDENDGFFDHIPPFVVPTAATGGELQAGISANEETDKQTGWPLGAGYRIPFIVASPWSKGGYVNSQTADHTSCLMFLEHWLSKKAGKRITTPMISKWRREVFSNLTGYFRPYNGETFVMPKFEKREQTVTRIELAKTKPLARAVPLTATELDAMRHKGVPGNIVTEKGVKKANAVPYNQEANLSLVNGEVKLTLAVTSLPGAKELKGAGFNVYSYSAGDTENGKSGVYNYGLKANSRQVATLMARAEDDSINIEVQGVNGFYRKFRGKISTPGTVVVEVKKSTPGGAPHKVLTAILANTSQSVLEFTLSDGIYDKGPGRNIALAPGQQKTIDWPVEKSHGWYNLAITCKNASYLYAGHIEDGVESITDPYMGGVA